MSSFNVNGLTKLTEDREYIELQAATNAHFASYKTTNFRDAHKCGAPNTRELSLNNPTIIARDGYGWTSIRGCNIDHDSELRNARNLTNTRCINHLYERPHKTTPFLARGNGDISIESTLKNGQLTNFGRVSNTTRKCINRFVPQIPPVRSNIQNPKNIIPEDNNKQWRRGGIPSRQTFRISSARHAEGE